MIRAVAQRVRARLGLKQRSRLAQAVTAARRPTAILRKPPDFLVLGAMRCGTSSLYRYLIQHPGIARPARKEIAFFTKDWDRGEPWYRCHFPLMIDPRRSFDATPDYLVDPRAPARVRSTLGSPPMVVLLRDPVERAWSHFRHMRRLEQERNPTFSEALAAEAGVLEAHPVGSMHYRRYSYFERGKYAEQLSRWFGHHSRDRFLILFTDDFFTDPAATLARVEAFVGVSTWVPETFENWSYRSTNTKHSEQAIPVADRAALRERFRSHDEALEALLKRPLPWRGA